MPLTPAEKQRQYRERLKNKDEEYKLKNKEQVRRGRERQQTHLETLNRRVKAEKIRERREADRSRVAKFRERKKMTPVRDATQCQLGYQNVRTMRKAVARADKALPSTPRRRKTIIRSLYQRNVTAEDEVTELPKKLTSPCSMGYVVSEDTIKLIKNFYERDDISRQAPGRKEVILVRNDDGNKETKQKRHLLSSVKETYAIFKKENPHACVGKTKFTMLRPQHVLLSRKLPHNVCLCL